MKRTIIGAQHPPLGQARAFVPPSPWSGDWAPDDSEFMRWGATGLLVSPSADPNKPVLEVGVLDCTWPMPLPGQLTLIVEFIAGGAGAAWQDRIDWNVNLGVGRSAANVGPSVQPKGAAATAGRPYAPDVVTLAVPMRQVSISAVLTVLPPPTPASFARYRVTACIAPFG
jgi:hypothetical protein